ncbi:hypothetical protein L1766_03865 [Thermovorax subterraneus]|nr:hypothetical protein [Thermovorax subterraneus]
MDCKTIMAILVDNRTHSAPKVQEILTKYGCNIKVRLGLHEVDERHCSDEGLIILQLCGSEEDIQNLEKELNSLERVKARRITLSL